MREFWVNVFHRQSPISDCGQHPTREDAIKAAAFVNGMHRKRPRPYPYYRLHVKLKDPAQ